MTTGYDQLKFWQGIVDSGKGDWQSLADPRGIMSLPSNTCLSLDISDEIDMFDHKSCAIFSAVRLKEKS